MLRMQYTAGRWWCSPLILALGSQRQADLFEFEASWSTRASSRTVSKATPKTLSQKKVYTCIYDTLFFNKFIHLFNLHPGQDLPFILSSQSLPQTFPLFQPPILFSISV